MTSSGGGESPLRRMEICVDLYPHTKVNSETYALRSGSSEFPRASVDQQTESTVLSRAGYHQPSDNYAFDCKFTVPVPPMHCLAERGCFVSDGHPHNCHPKDNSEALPQKDEALLRRNILAPGSSTANSSVALCSSLGAWLDPVPIQATTSIGSFEATELDTAEDLVGDLDW